jgi:hypothetical protein
VCAGTASGVDIDCGSFPGTPGKGCVISSIKSFIAKCCSNFRSKISRVNSVGKIYRHFR